MGSETAPLGPYESIALSATLIWKAQINEAKEAVAPFTSSHLAAATAASELLIWTHTLDNSDESMKHAMDSYLVLEEKVTELYNQSKPPSTSAWGSFFGGAPQKTETPEEAIERTSNYIEALVTLGDISGGIAMLLMRSQERMKAAYRLRKAWKSYEEADQVLHSHSAWNSIVAELKNAPGNEAIEQDSARVWEQLLSPPSPPTGLSEDALRARNIVGRLIFGKGLFCYTISMLPPSLQWFVELIGFTSDRNQGLADILCATRIQPSPRSYWARAALGTIRYFYFDETEESMKLVEKLLDELQQSPMLHMILGGIYRAEGRMDESTECYRKAYKEASEIEAYQLVVNYEIGHNFVLKGDWATAIPLIEEYIEKSSSPNFKAFGGYKLGFCYWMSLPREEALEKIKPLYRRVIDEYKRPRMSYDAYAARMCESFLKQDGYSPVDALLIQIGFLEEGLYFDQAQEKLDEVKQLLSDSDSADRHGLYHYWQGHLHFKKEELMEALKSFQGIVEIGDRLQAEKWVLTYAELESVDILMKKEDYSKAQVVLDSAKKRSGYDFEKNCSMRIKKLQNKIQRERSTKA